VAIASRLNITPGMATSVAALEEFWPGCNSDSDDEEEEVEEEEDDKGLENTDYDYEGHDDFGKNTCYLEYGIPIASHPQKGDNYLGGYRVKYDLTKCHLTRRYYLHIACQVHSTGKKIKAGTATIFTSEASLTQSIHPSHQSICCHQTSDKTAIIDTLQELLWWPSSVPPLMSLDRNVTAVSMYEY